MTASPIRKVRGASSQKQEVDRDIERLQILEGDLVDPANKPVLRQLRTDLKRATEKGINRNEIKMLVSYYYTFQMDRIRMNNRIKAFESNNSEPVAVLSAFSAQVELLEDLMKSPLLSYVENHPVGGWLIDRKGIGPVLAAGLLSHLVVKREFPREGSDIPETVYYSKVSQWWRFGGYDPTLVWAKGQKRPYNAPLKTLFYKVGKSIVMVGKDDLYRELYDRRKEYANAKNAAGGYSQQAAEILARIKKKASTEEEEYAASVDADVAPEEIDEDVASRKKMISLLERGMITPAAIDAQSRRWMVQMFLSHLHTVMWEITMGTPAALPYAMAHLNPDQHFEYIAPPDYISLKDRETAKTYPVNGVFRKTK